MPKLKDKNLVQDVHQAILKKIVTLEIEPGEIINEKSLLEEFGVSRTPLRMALAILRQENLVGGEPNKSSFARDLSLSEFRELVESLIIIEKNTHCLAAERMTPEELSAIEDAGAAVERAIADRDFWAITRQNFSFHGLISSACHNDILHRIHQTLRTRAERYSYLAVSKDIDDGGRPAIEHNTLISRQHRELILALRKRDLDRVEAISIKHVNLFKQRVIQFFNRISYR
jgi:DNA-binding GntR family transcriptional regulator